MPETNLIQGWEFKNLRIVEGDDGGVVPVVLQVAEEKVAGEDQTGKNHKCPNHPLLTS